MPERPLEGVRVIDLTHALAGPFGTMLLADMGADVIKVERPSGDFTRYMGQVGFPESAPFMAINRNKRGTVIDLRKAEGKQLLHQLLKTADILVENYTPGTMDALGFSVETVLTQYPWMIYASISGFGQTGPLRDERGVDLIAQGMTGMMSPNGGPEAKPVKTAAPIADLTAGMYCAHGILNAYIYRLRTGKGQHVDASLLESLLSYTVWETVQYWSEGVITKPEGTAHPYTAAYQSFRTRDGWMNMAISTEAIWDRFCKDVDLEQLHDDERFRTNADRMRNLSQLIPILEARFLTQDTAYWVQLLRKAGVPNGPVYNIAQVWEDPHILARGMLVDMEHPVHGMTHNIGVAVKLSTTPGQIRSPAPTVGQHTDAVLRSLGINEEEILRLRANQVVK